MDAGGQQIWFQIIGLKSIKMAAKKENTYLKLMLIQIFRRQI